MSVCVCSHSSESTEGSICEPVNVEYEYIKKNQRLLIIFLEHFLESITSAQVALPGGCNIGSRPIDQHLKGFKALGAIVRN